MRGGVEGGAARFWDVCGGLRVWIEVSAGDIKGGEGGFGVLRQAARPASTRLEIGQSLRVAQASRNTSVRPRNWLDNTTRAPLTPTRGPLITTATQVPSCEVTETMLSENRMNLRSTDLNSQNAPTCGDGGTETFQR
jgi:hypothetical protein